MPTPFAFPTPIGAVHDLACGWPYPAQSASWTPAQLSDVAFWQSADYGVSLDGASSRVWNWASRTGVLSASQATTSRMPLLIPNVQNGLPAVLLDGADDYLEIASDPSYKTPSVTVFVAGVSQPGGGLIGTNAVICVPVAGNNYPYHRWGILEADNHTRIEVHPGGTRTAPIPFSTLTTPYVMSYSNSPRQFRLNGTTLMSDAGVKPVYTDEVARIGAAGDASFNFKGYLFEILVCGRTLSASEIDQVETYLRAKWGIA